MPSLLTRYTPALGHRHPHHRRRNTLEYSIRPISPEEAPAFFQCHGAAFSHDFQPDLLPHTLSYAELDRTGSVWDGGQVVGTTGVWSFEMTVPGATLPCAGVTWVSVRPTHRRRGILTAMMRSKLEHIRDRGEPIAMLWASEAPIYARFGYGLATEGVELRIERTRTALAHPVSAPGTVRFVSRDEALSAWPAVYDRVRPGIPGMHSRSTAWWEHRVFREPEFPAPGFSSSFFVQYEEAGQVLGYVRYRVRETEEDGSATSTLTIRELMAATRSAYAALWQFVFGVDLIGTIKAEWRRADEPLYHMLADPRRLVRRPTDTVFCRIMDPGAALSGRRYATEGAVVIEVTDAFAPWAAGRFLLEGGPAGAICAATTREPDITLSSTELGAIFLGGTRLAPLWHAGRVSGTPEAIARADAMFGWHTLPWAPEIW
ncbi:MAG: GNAT family N-acetyltransferase [Dehalococcoidia bacterium]|nr:GNAT family N-acetyltransferase [Dehalococcoidia bacterium]